MNGAHRLSLRARLLILLIGVTTVFLLVMGAVAAVVLTHRLNGQFNGDLAASLTRTPKQLSANPGGDLAAAISPRTGVISLLTPGATGDQFARVLGQTRGPQLRYDYNHQPFPLTLPGGTRLRAVAKLVRAARLPSPARGAVLLVIARPVTSLSGQVHGVVVAELITGGLLLLILALSGG
jgi:hypothetical protein